MLVQRGRTLKKGCLIAALFSMLLSAAPAFAQTVTAMWDPSPASDQVTGYQVCVSMIVVDLQCGAGPGRCFHHGLHVRADRWCALLPCHPREQRRRLESASSEVSFSIPSLAQPANQSSIAGATITPLALSIADPDGSPLTITHTGLPVGLSINSATRQITGVPSAAGIYNVTLFVNDGLATVSRSFVWAVGAATNLIWHNNLTGQNLVWYLNGSALLSLRTFRPLPTQIGKWWLTPTLIGTVPQT